jgi:hypothetical protein
MYAATDYADPMGIDPDYPTSDPRFTGSAFLQQKTEGVTFADPGDDRVTYIGDAYDPSVQRHRSLLLEADLFSTGDSVDGGVVFGPVVQQPNVTRSANVPNTPAVLGGNVIQSTNQGEWYDTLRPHAGWALPVGNDQQYAFETGDSMGERFGETEPFEVEPGVRIVAERALDIPWRESMHPATPQAVYEDWDLALGSVEWSGQKASQGRPVADPGPWFNEPLYDSIANAGGAGGAMTNPEAYNYYPQPMTFRAPPSPWDQGENELNGYYVNGG